MFDLTNPIYHNEEKAREHLEALHWPNGPVCPHCGVLNENTKVKGKSARPGLYMCNACRKQFTVTVGTIFERSKIPLAKWLLAFRLMAGSKKGMSAHQLHRSLGITYKSAWFLAHRIREAMRDTDPSPIGGPGKIIEADETYVGGKVTNMHAAKRKAVRKGGGMAVKEAVVSLVERDGRVRSFHVANVTGPVLRAVLVIHADRRSWLMTDEHAGYKAVGKEFVGHASVSHSTGEYMKHGIVHTNTVENFYSIFKRGVIGTYHSISKAHLHRYCVEFDFRYNTRDLNDAERTDEALTGARGKRLTYRQPVALAA